jgi:hypothetical protein
MRSRRLVRWCLGAAACAVVSILLAPSCALIMPGDSYDGPLPVITEPQGRLSEMLREDVVFLAGTIGERNLANPTSLRHAENYIAASLAREGYAVRWQTYRAVTPDGAAHEVSNLEATITGAERPDEIVLVGAHYDSVNNFKGIASPGADDNASGTAGVLALARRMAGTAHPRSVRFVLFANEEPPYFFTDSMGSLVYAREAKRRGDRIVAMLSIESIGYYDGSAGSQDYPPPMSFAYPSTGDFIAFVGMSGSAPLVTRCVALFREGSEFPSEGAALPSLVPRVVASDHWSFWKQGYPALMVTDTARFRNPNYHKATDVPETLDYDRMARVIEGLERVVAGLADSADAGTADGNRP